LGHESWHGEDISDAREVGRGSERSGDVRVTLIIDEDLADTLLCAVVSGEEDEDIRLLLNRNGIIARAGLAWWAAAGLVLGYYGLLRLDR
jgi:hypothetical protein